MSNLLGGKWRSFRAVKSLVRLQDVVKGPSVKRQTTNALKYMQVLVRVQTQIQVRRVQMLENQELQRQSKNEKELETAFGKWLSLSCLFTGTHVDTPAHFYAEYLDAGFDADTLDLDVLNGPALLVDVPCDSNVTEVVMKSLHIPKEVRRVLFRTLNTDRRLMFKKEFDSSYVGFTKDGAQW